MITSVLKQAFRFLYYKNYIPYRVKKLRKQDKIKVVFSLTNLGAWKTEELYRLMLDHPRFDPYLIISKSVEEDDRENLRLYFKEKDYKFYETDFPNQKIWDVCYPDILFYQKPYCDTFGSMAELLHFHKCLFCYVSYAFHNSIEEWSYKWPYLEKCWQIYYENETLRRQYAKLLDSKIPNTFATGVPMMDELLISKNEVADQWKSHSPEKKRIIYAPHHSINPENWWQSSTFLETGEDMLRLAEKYSDRVQWTFKPHPLLRYKLEKIWGKERTDEYYRKWSDAEWSQFEAGKYLGLFKHSDAMIHDCGSFILEFLYTGNPAMYLVKDENIDSKWNETYRKAYHLHYKAKTIDEIERFIQNVIDGKDDLKAQRDAFIDKDLIPPFGQSASQNIIDCILYSDKARLMQK